MATSVAELSKALKDVYTNAHLYTSAPSMFAVPAYTATPCDPYDLARGPHPDPLRGRCFAEWVAWLANEPHSDYPVTMDPTVRTIGVCLNDGAPTYEDRQRLKPLAARAVGTANDGRGERRKAIFDAYQNAINATDQCEFATAVGAKWAWELGLKALEQMLPTEPLTIPNAERHEELYAETVAA